MSKYITAVDQGTTSTRCIIFTHQGYVVGANQLEHEQIYPQPGWVEHDLMEIWQNTEEVIRYQTYDKSHVFRSAFCEYSTIFK